MTDADFRYIDAHELKTWIHDDAELALLDVREHGQYGENHLFFAVPLPYSVLELDLPRLVPNKRTRIALYGDAASGAAVLASARVLARLGYVDVHILRGGIEAWRQAGYATFAGVNLPSKTFGELAEHVYHTPHISAEELHGLLQDKSQNVVVLDGRPVSEYRKMNIPGAICCPNGELALRVGELVPDPKTTIVINCAGRTRSIIGAQTLINLGIPNKVIALENGTQGWCLADHTLEHHSDRLYPQQIDASALPALRERSARLAQKHALPTVSGAEVDAWLREGRHSVFVCDVRTEEEYLRERLPGNTEAGAPAASHPRSRVPAAGRSATGHPDASHPAAGSLGAAPRLPAFVQHAPGGQLIQATDQYIGVRKARIVLYDADGIRAPVVASWLKQLGWNVYLLADLGPLAERPDAPAYRPTLKHTLPLAPEAVPAFLSSHPHAVVLDARPSQEFRQLRLAASSWVVRPTLPGKVTDAGKPVLLLGADKGRLELLALDLEQAGCTHVHLAVMNAAALKASGLPLAHGAQALPDAACIDFLFFVHDRHDGNKEAARKYLEWETNLVPQLDEQERSTFSIGH
jgi:rhodanese-related sulfurtransferase